MLSFIHRQGGTVNLQATLSSSTAGTPALDLVDPHHPITCSSDLRLEDDGIFACEHGAAPSGDVRTQSCINQSVAMLLLELAALL